VDVKSTKRKEEKVKQEKNDLSRVIRYSATLGGVGEAAQGLAS
jgi:hypothetical protein